MSEANPWRTVATCAIVVLIIAASLAMQSIVTLWAVRQLGSELPIDMRRVAAVSTLLFMLYGTAEIFIRVWKK